MSGEENSSKRYGYDAIKKLVEEQKAKGRDFVFMGAKTLTKILIHANKFLREIF